MLLTSIKRAISSVGEKLLLTINVDITNPMRAFRVAIFYSLFNDFVEGLDEILNRVIQGIKKRLEKVISSEEFSDRIIEEAKSHLEQCNSITKLVEKIQENVLIKADMPEELTETINLCEEVDKKLESIVSQIEKRKFVFTESEINSLKRTLKGYKLKPLLEQIYKIWASLAPGEAFV